MTNNNPFIHPLEYMLRKHAYGEIDLIRYATTYCGETCRDWRPFTDIVYGASPWETQRHYERRLEALIESEEAARVCQGHLVVYEKLQGMLRSFSLTPATEDRAKDGSLSLTVLPWDAAEKRLTSSRVVRMRIFDYDLTQWGFYAIDSFGASALSVGLRQWRLTEGG